MTQKVKYTATAIFETDVNPEHYGVESVDEAIAESIQHYKSDLDAILYSLEDSKIKVKVEKM